MLIVLFALEILTGAASSPQCPPVQAGAQPIVTTEKAAIEIARSQMIRAFTAEVLAGYGTLMAEADDSATWHVHGWISHDPNRPAPGANVCQSNGTILETGWFSFPPFEAPGQ